VYPDRIEADGLDENLKRMPEIVVVFDDERCMTVVVPHRAPEYRRAPSAPQRAASRSVLHAPLVVAYRRDVVARVPPGKAALSDQRCEPDGVLHARDRAA